MSESLARPWILKHLIQIAETRGANIHDASPLKEKRKIQITKFLTFPSNDRPNDIIWALISDKQYEITAKFTADAIAAYNRENGVSGVSEEERRLTTRRFAIGIITDVKAFFARVPLGTGKGMSDTETIALEVDNIRILGADQEGIFGNPGSVEENEDIQVWISGLREGGGGGNVLKRMKDDTKKKIASPSPVRHGAIVLSEKNTDAAEASRQPEDIEIPDLDSPKKDDRKVSLVKAWYRKWKTLGLTQAINDLALSVQVYQQNTPYTPLPSPATRGEVDNTQRREPSTPSVWEESEDEAPSSKMNIAEADRGSSPAALLPTPSRTCPPNSDTPKREEDAQQGENDADDEGNTSSGDEEGSKEDEIDEDRSDRSENDDHEEAVEIPFLAPTPAQRPKQSIRVTSTITEGRHLPSQVDSSQSQNAWAPEHVSVSIFPYHAEPGRINVLHDTRLAFETSQSQSNTVSAPQQKLPSSSLSQHIVGFSSQENSGNSAPKVLVPDSDASLNANSQLQSQSQSQSQYQSHQLLRSQAAAHSYPQTKPPPSMNNDRENLSRTSQNSMPAPPSLSLARSPQPADPDNAIKRVPFSPSRAINQSQQKAQSSDNWKIKRHPEQKVASQSEHRTNSMSESHTQTDTQSRDTGTTLTLDTAPATFAESTAPVQPIEPALDQIQQSSSVTQEDSQDGRVGESVEERERISNIEALDEARPKTLDADYLPEQAEESRSIQQEGKLSAREAYRLKHIQGSPTSRLGKHPRSSSPSLRSINSTNTNEDRDNHVRKKLRTPASADDVATSIAPEIVVHDSKAWKAPSFQQRREAGSSAGSAGRIDDGRTVGSKCKGKQFAVKGSRSSSTIRTTDTKGCIPTGNTRAGDSPQEAKSSRSSQIASRTDSTQDTIHEKSKKRKHDTVHITPSVLSSSRVKVEDSDDYSLENALLDGFACDLILHREPGGPKWLNWEDAVRILSSINKKREAQDQEQ